MPYVPPHRRLSHDGATPPSSSSHPSSMAINRLSSSLNRRADLLPDLRISRSQNFIGRFFVLVDSPQSGCPHLQLTRFEGQSFGHLRPYVLYSFRQGSCANEEAMHGDAKVPSSPSEQTSDLVARMSLDSNQTSQMHSTIKALESNITEVLERFKALEQTGSRHIPNMWIRFGKLLFQSNPRCPSNPDWSQINTPQLLEEGIKKPGQIMKTFDNMLSSEEFNHLQDMARRHASERKKREKFLIEIEDRKGPNSHLWLVCMVSKRNGDTALVNTHDGQLQMRKMRLVACRHMVADLACIGKSRDIRLVFFTRESILSFNEVEMNDLNSIVNKAHVDENVKGGLRWPLDAMCSTSGRFNVVGLSHVVRTTLVGAGIQWSFEAWNRTEFKASSGRATYEVMLNSCGFKDYFKANRDGSTDDLRQRIEKLLEQTWTDWALLGNVSLVCY